MWFKGLLILFATAFLVCTGCTAMAGEIYIVPNSFISSDDTWLVGAGATDEVDAVSDDIDAAGGGCAPNTDALYITPIPVPDSTIRFGLTDPDVPALFNIVRIAVTTRHQITAPSNVSIGHLVDWDTPHLIFEGTTNVTGDFSCQLATTSWNFAGSPVPIEDFTNPKLYLSETFGGDPTGTSLFWFSTRVEIFGYSPSTLDSVGRVTSGEVQAQVTGGHALGFARSGDVQDFK